MHIKNIFKKSTVSGQFVRNGLVAAVTLVVDYSVFWSLQHSVGPTMALIIGYCSGVVINFILCTIWVFTESRYTSIAKQFAIFSLYAGTGLVVEVAVFSALRYPLPIYMARIGSIVVTFFWNFALKELVIFRKRGTISLKNILSVYGGLTVAEKLYLFVRFYTCPIETIVEFLPESGTVLEIGTGSGINLAMAKLRYPGLTLIGCDIDERKLKLANKIGLDGISTSPTDPLLSATKYDAVLIVDVLYLMNSESQQRVMDESMRRLKPGGRLIIKEMSSKPRWKASWNTLQEYISVHVTKMTSRTTLESKMLHAEDIQKYLSKKAYKTHKRHLDKKYIHPHAVVTAE